MKTLTKPTPPPVVATPKVSRARRWNIVWVVPVVALILGGWMLHRYFSTRGPIAQVKFDTADGISAGKTEVRCRSVKVGVVRDVKLSKDLKSVNIFLELDPDAEGLLRNGTRFWVVKPRLSPTEVSGLDTVLQGVYIELDPGADNAPEKYTFTGLETPAAKSGNASGLRLTLTAKQAAGSLLVGSPVYYRGFEVGNIESRSLELKDLTVKYNVFVQPKYESLVTANTRFWIASGLDVTAGSDGFRLRTPSVQTMLSGGIAFGVPEDMEPGAPSPDGAKFALYRDEDAAWESAFNPTQKFLLLFDQSVRGLSEKAPVEFRGIRIGRVARISFELVDTKKDPRIPVLVEIDPSLMRPLGVDSEKDANFIEKAVESGLRATLKTGSLIAGSLFVDLDYRPEAEPAQLGQAGDWRTIPTFSSGFSQIETKLSAILDKIQTMPIEQTLNEISAAAAEAKTTVAEAKKTLAEVESTAASARKTLDDPKFRDLPSSLDKTLAELQKSVNSIGPDGAVQGDLLRTLDELRASLRALTALSNNIDEKPNSLLFGRDSSGSNPKPKAPRVTGH